MFLSVPEIKKTTKSFRKKNKMLDGDCENGDAFDDGVYDGVSKVIVGEHPAHGVVYLKIEYMKDGDIVEKQHGTIRGQEITEVFLKKKIYP